MDAQVQRRSEAHEEGKVFWVRHASGARGSEECGEVLEKVDPGAAKLASTLLAPLSDPDRERESASKSRYFWQKTEGMIESFLGSLERRKKVYVEASSLEEWTLAQHNLEIVRQAVEMHSVDRSGNSSPRDQAMAANVEWILDQEGSESKIMLWAQQRTCVHGPARRGAVHGHGPQEGLRGKNGGVWIFF